LCHAIHQFFREESKPFHTDPYRPRSVCYVMTLIACPLIVVKGIYVLARSESR
jgi:hypothetical protein